MMTEIQRLSEAYRLREAIAAIEKRMAAEIISSALLVEQVKWEAGDTKQLGVMLNELINQWSQVFTRLHLLQLKGLK